MTPQKGDRVLVAGDGQAPNCYKATVQEVRGRELWCVLGADLAGFFTVGLAVVLDHEGLSWVRGHVGEIPDAFRAQVALVGNTAPALWQRTPNGSWVCIQGGAGGVLGDLKHPTLPQFVAATTVSAPT